VNKYRYAVAPNGIFDTIQGEGAMLGVPMTFLRLAGCSVGCRGCDTDYAVAERLSVAEIVERLQRLPSRQWVWLTGGEPTDHPLGELVAALHSEGYRVAMATAGVRAETADGWRVHEGLATGGVDFLSVSPHFGPASDRWVIRHGSQMNVVHALNGVDVKDFSEIDPYRWGSLWVTPCWYHPGDRMERVRECLDFVRDHPAWRLGIQAHKLWGVS
jgi:organic radical activating enzyme